MENSFSLLSLFTGDIMTTVVSLILVGFSIICWTIIIEKIRLWRRARRNRPHGDPDKAVAPFDKNLWFLSMTSAVGPFLGLFVEFVFPSEKRRSDCPNVSTS